jgi:hypothetical protein
VDLGFHFPDIIRRILLRFDGAVTRPKGNVLGWVGNLQVTGKSQIQHGLLSGRESGIWMCGHNSSSS